MGHLAKRNHKSKLPPKQAVYGSHKPGVPKVASQTVPEVPHPQSEPKMTLQGPLAGLSNEELDMIFCVAIKNHFEREQVWIPSVLRTMPLLEGINDKTGRPCRIYVRPGKRIMMVETLL